MVACDDYFMSEWQSFEEGEKFTEMLLPTVSGEVTRANEDIALDVFADELFELIEVRMRV